MIKSPVFSVFQIVRQQHILMLVQVSLVCTSITRNRLPTVFVNYLYHKDRSTLAVCSLIGQLASRGGATVCACSGVTFLVFDHFRQSQPFYSHLSHLCGLSGCLVQFGAAYFSRLDTFPAIKTAVSVHWKHKILSIGKGSCSAISDIISALTLFVMHHGL